jgi:AraC family transcriptional activator of pobA
MLVHFADSNHQDPNPMAHRPQVDKSVPIFDLYGERRHPASLDRVHVESIAARSSLHNWEIRPHRHHGLFQLLWLAKGNGSVLLDDVPGQLVPGSVVMVPQHCVHGFRFSRDAGGMVLTLTYPMLASLGGALGHRLLSMSAPFLLQQTRSGARTQVRQLWQMLSTAYETPGEFRAPLLESLVVSLLVVLMRDLATSGQTQGGQPSLTPASVHLARFTAAIERSFLTHAPLAHYASQLGLSTAHLNALCRQLAGRTALAMIHERLLLEARRNLVYTAMTIREVAETLGFSDPAYFTRFFRRATGMSPSVFREQTDLRSQVN